MNLRFVFGGFVIVAAVGFLMYTGIRETSSYYLTIGELLPRRDDLSGSGLRVAGRVRAGSIQYDSRTLRLEFEMGEFEKDGAGAVVPVSYTGIKPDLFGDGRDVIVEGRYADGRLEADKVLTACPVRSEDGARRGSVPGRGVRMRPDSSRLAAARNRCRPKDGCWN